MIYVLARLARKGILIAMLAALGPATALFVVPSDRGIDALLASRHEHIPSDGAPAIDSAPGSDDDGSGVAGVALGGIMFDDVRFAAVIVHEMGH
jgi:hypothetical protein